MATIRDMMPGFELLQPTTVDDAVALLAEHGPEAWVLAGGLDSFDWLKDRIKRPTVVVDLGGIEGLIHISELDWRPVEHPVRCSRWATRSRSLCCTWTASGDALG